MNYEVEFTDVAHMEVQDILLWMIGRDPNGAKRWQEGLETAAESLSMFPRRCPLAPENEAFDVEARQLLYGAYRILYTLIDSDDDGENDICTFGAARANTFTSRTITPGKANLAL